MSELPPLAAPTRWTPPGHSLTQLRFSWRTMLLPYPRSAARLGLHLQMFSPRLWPTCLVPTLDLMSDRFCWPGSSEHMTLDKTREVFSTIRVPDVNLWLTRGGLNGLDHHKGPEAVIHKLAVYQKSHGFVGCSTP